LPVEPDEAERGPGIDARDRRGVDALLVQSAQQALAEEAGRDRAEERHRPAEPGQAERDVER
jgi:hypothetical protein